jgi:hypothetical protein
LGSPTEHLDQDKSRPFLKASGFVPVMLVARHGENRRPISIIPNDRIPGEPAADADAVHVAHMFIFCFGCWSRFEQNTLPNSVQRRLGSRKHMFDADFMAALRPSSETVSQRHFCDAAAAGFIFARFSPDRRYIK